MIIILFGLLCLEYLISELRDQLTDSADDKQSDKEEANEGTYYILVLITCTNTQLKMWMSYCEICCN